MRGVGVSHPLSVFTKPSALTAKGAGVSAFDCVGLWLIASSEFLAP
jgi:hypothetical protein